MEWILNILANVERSQDSVRRLVVATCICLCIDKCKFVYESDDTQTSLLTLLRINWNAQSEESVELSFLKECVSEQYNKR